MTTPSKRPKPIVLTVLDGWGYRAETKGNAIALARKPNYDRLLEEFPNTLIHTSGPSVGLPEGQMGNSEVGHLNIGAGPHRADGHHAHRPAHRHRRVLSPAACCSRPWSAAASASLHLLGLLSDGGVHSHIEHLFALLRMARENKVERVFVHCFMDGRDTPPQQRHRFPARSSQQKMREYGVGHIASLTRPLLRHGPRQSLGAHRARLSRRGARRSRSETRPIPSTPSARSYEQGVTDEFVVPVVITTEAAPGNPPARRP